MQLLTELLLHHAPIPAAAQAALIAHPALIHNPHLTDETWLALYTTRPLPTVERASTLVRQATTTRRRLHVLTHERRVKPLVGLWPLLDPSSDTDALDACIATLPPGACEALARQEGWPAAVTSRAARRAGGTAMLWTHALDPATDPGALVDDVAAVVPVGNPKGWRSHRGAAWSALSSLRPDVCRLDRWPPDALVAIASSIHLWRVEDQQRVFDASVAGDGDDGGSYVRAALGGNPHTRASVLEQLADAGHAPTAGGVDQDTGVRATARLARPTPPEGPVDRLASDALERFVQRALPSSFRSKGRAWHAIGLVRHGALDDGQRQRVGRFLTTVDLDPLARPLWVETIRRCGITIHDEPVACPPGQSAPTKPAAHLGEVSNLTWLSRDRYDATAHAAAQRLGADPATWSHAVALAEDFRGTLAQLVDVARSLG